MTKIKNSEIRELFTPPEWETGKFYDYISKEALDEVCKIQADFFHTIFADDEEVVIVPVEIAGAVMYPNNLIKYIKNPERLDIAYVDVMSYKNEQKLKTMTINYSSKLPNVVKNKKIVILDTMYDKGTTILTLLDKFSDKSIFDIKNMSVFTMINKHPYSQLETKMSEFPLFYKLAPYLKVPKILWYRGYGLDDKRLLPYIQAKIPKNKNS